MPANTPRGADGKVYAAGFIYAMNLRNGLLRLLCCITNGTQRHHELPVLRNHIDHQNSQCDQIEKNIYVYDKAVTDFLWWAKQKAQQNYMISVLKDTWVKSYNPPTNSDKKSKQSYSKLVTICKQIGVLK